MGYRLPNKYALWVLEECDNPVDEIERLYSKLSKKEKLEIAIQMQDTEEVKLELQKQLNILRDEIRK